jgi:5-methylcytosine-specific restriction endonuclease McrA
MKAQQDLALGVVKYAVYGRPLDIDHIVPRSVGGVNDVSNYQALCWLCNTTKGNRGTLVSP